MLNVTELTNPPDLDQNHFLNGNGSVVIIPKVKKTSSNYSFIAGRNRLITHIKNHLTSYLVLLAAAVTVLVVLHIENDYQSTLDETLAENKQLKQILKETTKTSKTLGYQDDKTATVTPSTKEQAKIASLSPFGQPIKSKQPTAQTAQYNKADNKANLKFFSQQSNNEKINSKTPLQGLSTEKQKEKETSKIVENIATNQGKPAAPPPPKQSPPKQNNNPVPNQNSQASRAIAGITQDQREKAVKWLALKNQNIYEDTSMAQQERKYYQQKYNISSYEQLPICIVIPSHNNVKNSLHIKNIKSVLMQEYSNYHIVFIDDASTDGTGDQIAKFLANQTKISTDRYVIIKNQEQKRAMPNLRRAAQQFCKPEEIYIIVDGDDQLLGRQVLKLFNSIFQKDKAWFVYTNFLSIRGTVGYSRAFPQSTINSNKYRSYPFVTSHLRAFYTQLFLNIKDQDLRDEAGEYLKAANDVAICIPILEMSHERVVYVPELTYYYNSNTGQNNHQVRLKQQKSNDRMLRKRKSYQRLKQLQFKPKSTSNEPQKTSVSLKTQLDKEKGGSQVLSNKNNQ